MSVKGKKVLHIDRNDHYGGYVTFCTSPETISDHNSESASLNIEAVRMTTDYCIYHFLRRNSFSRDTAIIAKARNHGRNMVA